MAAFDHVEPTVGRARVTQRQVERALRACDGRVGKAARLLGTDYQTIRRAVDRWPRLRLVIHECREEILDLCEQHISAGVRRGDIAWVRMALEYEGKLAARVIVQDERRQVQSELAGLSDEELREARALGRGATVH